MAGKSSAGSSAESGGSRFGGAARAVGARGVQYVTASSGRQAAFLLIVAILLARLLLTDQFPAFWAALFGPARPLGQALPSKVAAGPDNPDKGKK